MNRAELLGPFPALDSEKRIFELVTRLWERREENNAFFLQMAPYEEHFNPERAKEQIIWLLQNYVSELCNVFKPSEEESQAVF